MYIHETQLRVLYAHTDKAGVVYYANYLQFFETGRTEYFRSLGKSYADFERDGIMLTVCEASCKYLAPAQYDELITIRTFITQLRRTRIDFAYDAVGPQGNVLCQGTTILACISAATRRPCAIPDMMRQMLSDKLP